jgi:hypothetical protein
MDVCRIKALAAAAYVPERTLRAQWRSHVSSTVRISDVARAVRRALRERDPGEAQCLIADIERTCERLVVASGELATRCREGESALVRSS